LAVHCRTELQCGNQYSTTAHPAEKVQSADSLGTHLGAVVGRHGAACEEKNRALAVDLGRREHKLVVGVTEGCGLGGWLGAQVVVGAEIDHHGVSFPL
jgi:hypothetical protein